jgi:hypothetical protein
VFNYLYYLSSLNVAYHTKKNIIKSKKCNEKVTKVTSVSLSFRVESLLDNVTLTSLDDDGFYLYQILMARPDHETLVFNFNDEMFEYDGSVRVFLTDGIELMKGAWLNVSIV